MMKISIDVDLSPQEARELFGWPDLSQLHESTLAAMQQQLEKGDSEALMALLQPYIKGSQQAFSLYQSFFDNLAANSGQKK